MEHLQLICKNHNIKEAEIKLNDSISIPLSNTQLPQSTTPIPTKMNMKNLSNLNFSTTSPVNTNNNTSTQIPNKASISTSSVGTNTLTTVNAKEDNLWYMRGVFNGSIELSAFLIESVHTYLSELDSRYQNIELVIDVLRQFHNVYFVSQKLDEKDVGFITKSNKHYKFPLNNNKLVKKILFALSSENALPRKHFKKMSKKLRKDRIFSSSKNFLSKHLAQNNKDYRRAASRKLSKHSRKNKYSRSTSNSESSSSASTSSSSSESSASETSDNEELSDALLDEAESESSAKNQSSNSDDNNNIGVIDLTSGGVNAKISRTNSVRDETNKKVI